jgi:hypothetical protein
MYNPYSFISTDIIVWNKIICLFGAVSHLISEDDELRIANDDEEKHYKIV